MHRFVLNSNQQTNGDHEVHDASTGCHYLPSAQNQIDLGWHANCQGAVAQARRQWPGSRINGCYYCCRQCHTS